MLATINRAASPNCDIAQARTHFPKISGRVRDVGLELGSASLAGEPAELSAYAAAKPIVDRRRGSRVANIPVEFSG